jgi:hypothetical protein
MGFLAALITTLTLAKAFRNGTSYFITMAVQQHGLATGLAVLNAKSTTLGLMDQEQPLLASTCSLTAGTAAEWRVPETQLHVLLLGLRWARR